MILYFTTVLNIQGWVERSETQQKFGNVGFRSSTQPTAKFYAILAKVKK